MRAIKQGSLKQCMLLPFPVAPSVVEECLALGEERRSVGEEK